MQQINGQWWIVRPDGTAAFLNSIQASDSEGTEFNNWLAATYTDRKTYYLNRMIPLAQKWNYNAISGFVANLLETDYQGGNSGLFHSMLLWCSGRSDPSEQLMRYDGAAHEVAAGATSHAMGDPWNLSWRSQAAAQVHYDLAQNIGTSPKTYKNSAIHSVDGEVNCKMLEYDLWSPACSTELINFLKSHYNNDLNALNTAWSADDSRTFNYAAWDDIKDPLKTNGRPRPESYASTLETDLQAFVRILLDEYFSQTVAIVKNEAPGLIVGGPKYTHDYIGAFVRRGNADLLSHYDVVNFQWTTDPESYYVGMSPQLASMLQNIEDACKRPMSISEWMVNSNEVDFQVDHYLSIRRGFYPTQDAKGKAYATYMRQLVTLPFMVGQEYWQFVDMPNPGDGPWPMGLVRAVSGSLGNVGEPYDDFVAHISSVNEKILNLAPSCRTWDGSMYIPDAPGGTHKECKCTGQPVSAGLLMGLVIMGAVLRKKKA